MHWALRQALIYKEDTKKEKVKKKHADYFDFHTSDSSPEKQDTGGLKSLKDLLDE